MMKTRTIKVNSSKSEEIPMVITIMKMIKKASFIGTQKSQEVNIK